MPFAPLCLPWVQASYSFFQLSGRHGDLGRLMWSYIAGRNSCRRIFSFPSGHSITACSVAVSLGSFYPAVWPALLFLAISIAVSRVLLGMHYASDVIVGAAIGTILGYAAIAVVI